MLVSTQEFLFEFPPLKRAELSLIDLRFQKRAARLADPDSSSIVIVGISQESFKTLPDRWPWPKEYYTRLIRNLRRAGARAIGIDVIFSSSDPDAAAAEKELRDLLEESPEVVLAGKLEPEAGRYRILRAEEGYGNIFTGAADHLGLVNVVTDEDGVLRRYMPFAYDSAQARRIPTFSMAMLNAWFGMRPGPTVEIDDGVWRLGAPVSRRARGRADRRDPGAELSGAARHHGARAGRLYQQPVQRPPERLRPDGFERGLALQLLIGSGIS